MSLALPAELEEILKFAKPFLEALAKSVLLDEIKKRLYRQKSPLTLSQQIGKIITEEIIKFEQSHPDLEGHTFLEWENNVKILSRWILEGCQEDCAVLQELEKFHKYRSNNGNYSAVTERELKSILNNLRQSVNQVAELRCIKDSVIYESIDQGVKDISITQKSIDQHLQNLEERLEGNNTSIKKSTTVEVVTTARPLKPSAHFTGRDSKMEEIEGMYNKFDWLVDIFTPFCEVSNRLTSR